MKQSTVEDEYVQLMEQQHTKIQCLQDKLSKLMKYSDTQDDLIIELKKRIKRYEVS